MMKNRRVSAYQEEHTETKLRKICGIYAGNSRKRQCRENPALVFIREATSSFCDVSNHVAREELW